MKKKKLSEKQQQNMAHARQKKHSENMIEKEVLLRAHLNRFLLCEDLTTKQLFQIHNNKRFQVVVGDRLLINGPDLTDLKLVAVLPRRNVLERLDERVRAPLAANIDLACLVFSCYPELWPQILAQYRCYVRALNIPHLIIINKVDIGYPSSSWQQRLEELQRFAGDRVLYVSAQNGDGLHELSSTLASKTSIFLGPSGVGKSSLLKTLLGEASIKVGALSQSERGAHTTSVTQYYHFNDGGLIDSPGVRQFALDSLSLSQLLTGFEDFKNVKCRFHDCEHIVSQGCAIKDGITSGLIGKFRYEDYLFLKNKFKI